MISFLLTYLGVYSFGAPCGVYGFLGKFLWKKRMGSRGGAEGMRLMGRMGHNGTDGRASRKGAEGGWTGLTGLTGWREGGGDAGRWFLCCELLPDTNGTELRHTGEFLPPLRGVFEAALIRGLTPPANIGQVLRASSRGMAKSRGIYRNVLLS